MMKVRTMQYIGFGLVTLWFIVLFSISPEGDGRNTVFILGLMIMALCFAMIAQYIWWLYTSTYVDWPSGRTTIRQHSHNDHVYLAKMPDSERSNHFLMYSGGLHRWSARFTKPREVLFVNEDCIKMDKGDLIHIHARGQPLIFRRNPNPRALELDISNLDPAFKRKLYEHGIPDDIPVLVFYDPILADLDSGQSSETLKWKELYHNANAINEELQKMVDKLGSASSTLSDVHERSMRATAKDVMGKKPFLSNVLRPENEPQEAERR